MAGYLDTYGVNEERRGRLIKRTAITVALVAIIAASAYFYFRTYSQEKVVQQFLADINSKDLQAAYNLWCPPQKPCRYFPFEKFSEDWGPASRHSGEPKIENVDYCGEGVFFRLTFPKGEPVGLWVDRNTNLIDFAPEDWTRCPGRHWEFKHFFQQLFSSKDS